MIEPNNSINLNNVERINNEKMKRPNIKDYHPRLNKGQSENKSTNKSYLEDVETHIDHLEALKKNENDIGNSVCGGCTNYYDCREASSEDQKACVDYSKKADL